MSKGQTKRRKASPQTTYSYYTVRKDTKMGGFKTYIMSAVMAGAGALDLSGLTSILPEDGGLMTIGLALAIAALRHGVAKSGV